jgi:DNA-binding MarR family transcriptional regulator
MPGARDHTTRGRGNRRHEIEILTSLRRIIRAVDIHSRKLKMAHDLTAPQLVCLLTVVESAPLTATELARRVHLSASTLVGILDRLEAKSLIRRVRGAADRRVVHVEATPRGQATASRAPSPLQDGLAAALGRLPRREQVTIAESLERIVDLMEAGDIEAAPILDTGKLGD